MPGIALKALQAGLVVSAVLLILSGVSASLMPDEFVGAVPDGMPGVDATPPERAAADYAVIGRRNLFQIVRAPVAAPQPTVELQETRLEVELLATISSSAPPPGPDGAAPPEGESRETSVAVALLRDIDGESKALGIGGTFAEERAVVVEIQSGDVVIEHDGKLEVLRIEPEEVAPPPSSARRENMRAGAARRERQRGARQPGRRGQNLDPLLSTQLGPLLVALGVRTGDRIVAIDGEDLGDEPNPLGLLLDPGAPEEQRLITLEAADGSAREIVAPADIRARVEAALTAQRAQ